METTVWQAVHERLDPMLQAPQLRPDVVIQALESRRHGPYVMIKSPQAGAYLKLSPREHYILGLMDGTRSVKEITLTYFYEYGSLAFNRVIQLVNLLHHHGFLVNPSLPTYALVGERLRARRGVRGGLHRVLDFLVRAEISLRGIDTFVTALYRGGGWLLLTRPALILLGLIAACGFAAFHLAERTSHLTLAGLFAGAAGGLAVVAAVVFCVVQIICHELAHALVCKSFGREVIRGGFAVYFGFPAFFVDTTDIWLESRSRRIAVTIAGSISDMVFAGACSLLALVLPPAQAAVCLLMGGFAYCLVAWNLFPLLALDGYYVLVDLLEMPLLRARAFAFVRESLLRKLWRREPFTTDEVIFTAYGVLAGGFSILFFFSAFRYFEWQLISLVTTVAQTGSWVPALMVILLVTTMGIPLILRAFGLASHALARAGQGVRALTVAVESAQLRRRTTLLAGIPVLADLPPGQLHAIAAAMRERRYAAGSTIIRQGDQGDRFYLIVRGAAEVVRISEASSPVWASKMEVTRLASLASGDYFGERALLHKAPRAATVRAAAELDVLELSAGDFMRLISPTWQLQVRMARAVALRGELARLDLFKELGPADRDLLLTRLNDETFEPGATMIRQGELGERLYVIREGRVEVLRAEHGPDAERVAELGPGDFFGEIALLISCPRTATVRALTPVRAWSLGRQGFDDVLRHYLRMGDVFEATGQGRLAELQRRTPAIAG
ncbi:MAG: cyclic nucleotide-binding domain-containing protein [Chloroflexota bacterium]